VRWACRLSTGQRLAALIGGLAVAMGAAAHPAAAQQAGYGQTLGSSQQERELNLGTGPQRSGSILDSTNPLDLMNKLRRGTALDNATPPGDAVDAALKDFQVQSIPVQSQSSPLSSGQLSTGQSTTDQKTSGQQPSTAAGAGVPQRQVPQRPVPQL
jgi:hypothetical protein